jgi:hypothetical protein
MRCHAGAAGQALRAAADRRGGDESPTSGDGGAPGRRRLRRLILATAAAGLLAAAPAAGQERPILELAGASIRDLAAHGEVAGLFRSAVRGRQAVVAAALRAPASTPVQVSEGRFLGARACAAEGCGRLGIFLGWDAETARLYLLVVEDGTPVLVVPPAGTRWPAAFATQVAALRGE